MSALAVEPARPPATRPTTGPTVAAEDLPRVKPTEPADAPKTFRVRPGFAATLVAAEPDAIDPIALCFDENGRMFVVEMRDYSERRSEKLGRIRMLEDTDGDGTFEKSTVFLENLAWPTAVMCVNGGVLIGATPEIIFAKDNNADGVADEQRVLFTGFGATPEKLNVQGLFNNFQWGLDNRIHGCSGTNGGMVRQLMHPHAAPIDVRGKGFVIDPRDCSMTTEFGGGQYGLSFDPAGRLYTCSNSVHIETFMYDARYAGRNPHATLPSPRVCIALDGPAAEVYRISPEEPWRVIRTRWRVAGLVPGMIEGGGRSAGYFTGATGITIYKGDAFIGDAGGNLVHHKKISTVPDGVERVAERQPDEKKSEFFASSDNWFRPVDFANTPDGSLFVCDMYRETIEHPWSIPPQIKKYLDLNSGNDRGRIWRLAPEGFHPRRTPRFSEGSIAELVSALQHSNGWHRESASRVLFERQDKSAIPLLVEMAAKSKSAMGRMHALHAIEGLGAMESKLILAALRDADPIVREHAVRLSEQLPASAEMADALIALADDPAATVRFQLAFTLGQVKHAKKNDALVRIVRRALGRHWFRAAFLNSLTDGAGEVFTALAGESTFIADAAGQLLLREMAEMIGAGGDAAQVEQTVTAINACRTPATRYTLARALIEGATRSSGGTARAIGLLEGAIMQAKTLALDPKAPSADRRQAIGLIAFGHEAFVLVPLLGDRSQTIQLAALAALEQADVPDLPAALLSRWTKWTPRMQNEAVAVLLKRPARARLLVEAIRDQRIPANALDAAQVSFLHKHADAALRELSLTVLKLPARRDEVVERFRPALSLSGDAARGKAIYAARCISCHRADNEGFALGPDFVTVRNAGAEKLLLNILDPSREVANNYIAFLVETKSNESVVGVITSDTPAAVTIRQAYGRESVIPRANIKRMVSQGKSVMPEGVEEGLKSQDLADLIQYIDTAK
ncbi:MAG: PVC-type heme-binding CxxCH protein [Tepidisphaeraceae bacterium]